MSRHSDTPLLARLGLAWPHLDSALLTTTARHSLQQLALGIPESDTLLMEFRLSSAAQQVDLSQCFGNSRFHPRSELNQLWESQVMQHLGTDTMRPLPADIEQVWLEYDGVEHPQAQRLKPAGVFLQLPQNRVSTAHAETLITRSAQALGRDLSAKVNVPIIQRLSTELNSPQPPTYLGRMLRPGYDSLRLHYAGLAAAEVPDWLRSCNWTGATQSVVDQCSWLSTATDNVVACVDVTDQLQPTLGLELFCGNNLERARNITAVLVEQGLCSADKRDALLQWCGSCNPGNTADGWPDALILQGLTRAESGLEQIDRGINHFKLNWSQTGTLEAKVYLSLNHHWLDFDSGGID